ncbi:type IV toxin-antitoxin system AbiEi family antitoxin [Promicromonospora sp. NPDC023987]|uniref:type IV toxin-antitoxin system AbiEi family antitoxin n=1 Tax=Promicromonospora sp. NPDC023987 TaxID=3155360 RepID=UPI0034088D65
MPLARSLPPSLASIVEDLELDQPKVVTAEMLAEIVARHRLGTASKVVAARLRERGWLLSTGTKGVWEFAPGAHAGPYGHGEPTLPLQAALAARPGLPAALSLNTAAWALGYADRVPARLDVAVPPHTRVPQSLAANTNVTTYGPSLDTVSAKGAPTHRSESIVVHLASVPTTVRSWSAVLEWLPDLAADLSAERLDLELRDRPTAVRVRTGYLMSGLRPDLAEPLRADVSGPVRFGPRAAKVRRHDPSWRVLDALLQVDPAGLTEVTPT